MIVYVVWCKWSVLAHDFRLHYKKYRSKEKALLGVQKITKDSRKFIWSYIVDGKERDRL